jgi:thymidylate synthase
MTKITSINDIANMRAQPRLYTSGCATETAYLDTMCDILTSGEPHADRTGVGTLSMFGKQMRHSMWAGFPLLSTRKLDLSKIFAELMWFLSGSTNAFDLPEHTQKWWTPWAAADGSLGPVYGRQLRNARSFEVAADGAELKYMDQLQNVLHMIDTQPNSRRLIMTTWNAADVPQMRLPCCHGLVIQFKVHGADDSKLSLSTYQRSADFPVGVPANIASYALLLTMVAWATGKQPGELVYTFGDYHIYDNQHEGCFKQLSRQPMPAPVLQITADRSKFDDSLSAILSLQWSDIELSGYDPHPAIKFPVAV